MNVIDKILKLCDTSHVKYTGENIIINNKYWRADILPSGSIELIFFGTEKNFYLSVPLEDIIAIKEDEEISMDLEDDIYDISLYSRSAILSILKSIVDVMGN